MTEYREYERTGWRRVTPGAVLALLAMAVLVAVSLQLLIAPPAVDNKKEALSFSQAGDGEEQIAGLVRIGVASAEATTSLTGKTGTVYGPERLLDGDLSTCWQEGEDGPGYGAEITLSLDGEQEIRYIRIRPGSCRSERAFYENNRPATMTLRIGELEQTLDFEDADQWVMFENSEPVTADAVTLVLDSVYEGSRWDDTCITEVELYGE